MKNLFTVLLMLVVSLALAQNDTWTAKQDFGGGARFLGTAFSVGSKVYAGTGLDGTYVPRDDFWEYDVTNNSWSPKGSFDGGARGGSTGFTINGKGYVLFGTNISAMFKDVWEYNPANDTWLKKADFPGVARAGAFVFVINNKAYVGAGQDENSNGLTDLWEYDPAGDSWVQKTSLPSTPRLYAAAFAIGTQGYVGSGLDADENSLADFWQYDTSTDAWTQKANLPNVTSGAIGFSTATRGYIGLGMINKLFSYYSDENVWVEEASYPNGGAGYVNASVAVSGGKAYVGLGGVTGADDFYVYTPGTDQSITFNALATKTFGDAAFTLSATASSGLMVSFTSSNTSVATISGTTVTIVGAGTSNIIAIQAGNGTFDAALPVQRTLTVNKANQTLTFNALGAKNVNDGAFDLTATASSSLAVSYTSSNTAVATISGSTVTIVGAGTTTIAASQPGNANYNAATSVERELVVSKVNQTITFAALASKTVTSPSFSLAATASSGLAVSYVSSNTAVATILGSTVTIVGSGTTTITASQSGNATYNAATSVDRDLVVTKTAQSWNGTLPTETPFGSDVVLPLQLSSGLPYTLTSSNTGVATVTFNAGTWTVKPVSIGTTTLTASHPGNASFEAAPTLTQDLVVKKADQVITFSDYSASQAGFTVITATASSGLPVTFDEPVGMSFVITGNIITIYGSAGGNVVARQAGNDFYSAVETTRTVVIGKKDAPLAMEPLPEKAVGDAPFIPVVSSVAPSVPYSFSSTNPAVATIVAGKVTITGKGTTNIYAVNAGDAFYNPSSTYRELIVKEAHNITFGELPVKTLGDAPFNVQATSSTNVPVIFSSSDNGIATVEGNTVTIKGVGSAWIIATAGDANFARRSVSQALIVKNVVQTATQQGQFWGVSPGSGEQPAGSIYKTNADGSGVTIVKQFINGGDNGTHPGSSVIVGPNGKLYGWAGDGGSGNEGTIFEFDPATNVFTKRYELTFADYALKTFVVTSNGKMYGSKTRRLTNVYGTGIFEFDMATGTFTKDTGLAEGMSWLSDIFMSSAGKIYVTGAGTNLDKRVVGEYDPLTNVLTKKLEVPWSTTGTAPTYPVEFNGKFYGTTPDGGVNNEGFIYEFDPVANTLVQKIDFPKSNFNRTTPQGLMKHSNGKLYGCASWGGLNTSGYVYQYDPAQNTMTKLADFAVLLGVPTGQMIEGPGGKLYGTDNSGNMGGSLFEFDPANNVLKPLVIFNDYTGKAIFGNLGLLNGKLYAFPSRGGANNGGTIVEFDPATRTVVKKYDFSSASDGYSPMIGLTPASSGKLYGINKFGGANDNGVIFEIDPVDDSFKKVYDFNESTAGSSPQSPLLAGLNGKLYGSTWTGTHPNNSSGTIFEFDPSSGAYRILTSLNTDKGLTVRGALAQSKSGKLYGMTQYGGANSNGVLFELDPVTKVYRKLKDLTPATGKQPSAGVTIASNGKIYGTTPIGGANDLGVIFEFDPGTDAYTVKHSFDGATGAVPNTTLIEIDGKLWGTTSTGGAAATSKGVVFEYDLSTGVYTKKYEFDAIGGAPGGKMLHASNGRLYILTTNGGSSGGGALIVEYDIATNSMTKKSTPPSPTQYGELNINHLVQTVKSYKLDQAITVNPIGIKVLGQSPFIPTATATSGFAVVFSAGNANISVAPNGEVTMVKAGKAILKANQSGDSKYNQAPEVETTFCINPPKPTVTFTTNSSGTVTLTSSSENGNHWYKDGVEIPDAVNKIFEAKTPGVYTVKAIVEDCASEASSTFPVVVTGDVDGTSSPIIAYPNPATDRLFISLPGTTQKRIILLQADGRITEQHETSATLMEIDVRSYSPGLYFVRVNHEKGDQTIKFIKK